MKESMNNVKRAEAYHKSTIGQILVSRGYISQSELREVLDHQKGGEEKVGEILLERKKLSRWQLRRALSFQTRQRFAASLAIALLEPLVHLTGRNQREAYRADITQSSAENQRVMLLNSLQSSLSDEIKKQPLTYDPLQVNVEIKISGGIRVKIPSSYGEIVFEGVRLKGSAGGKAIDLELEDLELSGARVYLRSIFRIPNQTVGSADSL